MTKVVVGIALGANGPTGPIGPTSEQYMRCIESLQKNTHKPDLIQVTYYAETEPVPTERYTDAGGPVGVVQSLPPAMSRNVSIYRMGTDIGILGTVCTFMSTHPQDADAILIIVNGSCTYPPHLISEYLSSAPELHRSLIGQMPEANGSIYGLAGIIMTEDKKRYLDQMFDSLTSKDSGTTEHERLTVMSQTVNNATVHYLDPVGSIMFYRKQLSPDFPIYIDKVWDKSKDLSTDVLLSNYFASKKIVRTQMCNIFINRFMMARMGCFDGYNAASPNPTDVTAKYLDTIEHLRSLNAFCAYE